MIPYFRCRSKTLDEDLKNHLFQSSFLENNPIEQKVREIIEKICLQGDAGLIHCIQDFENRSVSIHDVFLSPARIRREGKSVPEDLKATLRRSAKAIEKYHRQQKQRVSRSFRMKNTRGVTVGQVVRPLRRVAVYVPGGQASYPSSVLMNAIPAQVAGVQEIVLVTPAADPAVLFAAEGLGIREVFGKGFNTTSK